LYAANRADSIKHGVELARHALASGAARQKLHDLVQFSQNNAPVV
jgi:anthranilate phosphoribosyltransferase